MPETPTTPSTPARDTTNDRYAAAIFTEEAHAERAIGELRAAGILSDRISVLRVRHEPADSDTDGPAERGIRIGGIGGGILGALGGLGAATMIAVPGVGLIAVAGALAGALGGAAMGALAAGGLGALVELGLPASTARGYERRMRRGDLLLVVQAYSNAQIEAARAIFDRCGGEDAHFTPQRNAP